METWDSFRVGTGLGQLLLNTNISFKANGVGQASVGGNWDIARRVLEIGPYVAVLLQGSIQ